MTLRLLRPTKPIIYRHVPIRASSILVKTVRYHNSINFSLNKNLYNIQPHRNLSTSWTLYNDKKGDDKKSNDDKNDSNKNNSDDGLSPPPLPPMAIALALLIGIYLYPKVSTLNQAQLREISTKDLNTLLASKQVISMKYYESTSNLIIQTQSSTVKIRHLNYDSFNDKVRRIYDQYNTAIDHRVDIQFIEDSTMSFGTLCSLIFNGIFALFVLNMFNPGLFNRLVKPNIRTVRPASKTSNTNQIAKKGNQIRKAPKKDSNPFMNMMQPGAAQAKIGTVVEPQDIKTDFSKVAGCEEAKIEVIEIVDFLRNTKKYEQMGAKVPKGAILYGPPGTGKTLMAKACAKEAGVTFIHCNGSDFIEMFVGLGSKRVRELFENAREHAPSILFIDEIDAVGGKRGGGMGGGGKESDQTLNAILAEMDGFNTTEPVVVMGATNQLDKLDKALIRPGRFDRQIYVGLPDVKGRNSIFKVHMKNIKSDLDPEEAAKSLAVKTPGMSGADIENIVNEAALHAVRYADDSVTMKNYIKAIDRVIGGMEKLTNIMDVETRKRIAVHEAGHCVASWFSEHAAPLVKVTIVPRTQGVLGFAQYQPKDSQLDTLTNFSDRMKTALGGRAAEQIFYGDVSSGAHDDLKKVTGMATAITTTLGMSEELKNINYSDVYKNQMGDLSVSEDTKQKIDKAIKTMIDVEYDNTIKLLTEKKHLIKALSDKLMEEETLERDDIVAVLGPRPYKDVFTYEDMIKEANISDDGLTLPPGLAHWEKSFENSIKFKSNQQSKDEKDTKEAKIKGLSLPDGWVELYDPSYGTYYRKDDVNTIRHPGKSIPPGWEIVIDEDRRRGYVHKESGYRSWKLEDDDDLPDDLVKELDEYLKKK